MKNNIRQFILGTLILLGSGSYSVAQTYNMPGGTVNTCSGTFYDTGGLGGSYTNNQNITTTICSNSPGNSPVLTFTAFNIESGWDFLTVYDGPNTSSPVIGTWTGTTSPGVVSGSGTCITIVFTSDGSVTASGWAATISCGPPPPPSTNYNMSNGSISACTGNFYDSGGAGGSYTNNQNYTFTICPSTPGAQVQVSFTSFNIESGWDFLTIYNGSNTSAPIIGTYTGSTSPGTVTAGVSGTGCLTFKFTSDGSVTASGWAASISCTVPCQTITANITSVSPAPVSGIVKACQGDPVSFTGSAVFSSSGVGAVYTWDFGDGTTQTGTSVTHSFSAGGAFQVGLTITDNVGCHNLTIPSQLIQVSTTPTIVTGVAPDPVCLGQSANLTSTVTMTPYVVNCTPPVSGVTPLPDASGGPQTYTSSISVDCYNPGQTVTSITDIQNICIDMEHSYLGDLNIVLTCPGGQSIVLKAYPGGGGTYLGAPIDSGPGAGTGSVYCFAPGAATPILSGPTVIMGTPPGPSIAAGTYAPVQPFTNLIGCPFNGSWTLSITDNLSIDDGYIFDWDVDFTVPAPAAASFTPAIVTQGWMADPDLTSTGLTTASITPAVSGTACYTYQVTDDFGCTYTEDQCLTVSVLPQMTSANTSGICSNVSPNLALTADVSSTFSWVAANNPNVTGASLVAQNTATISDVLVNLTNIPQDVIYTVTPTSTAGGCAGIAQTVTVTVNPLPTSTTPLTHIICDGMPVNLNLTADIPSTFDWVASASAVISGQSTTTQSGATITDVLSSLTGATETITYTITPSVGTCIGLSQDIVVTVNVLEATTSVVDSDCQACNGSITVNVLNGAAPFQFSIDGGATFQAGNIFNSLCGAVAPGVNYTVEVTDNLGCSVTVTDAVEDTNFPTLNAPNALNATCYTVCDGQITLTGTNLTQYQITGTSGPAAQNATGIFTGLCPDTYAIVVDNGFGCTVTGSTTITEPTPLQINSLTPDFAICSGDATTLNVSGSGGNGVYTYNWTAGAASLGSGTALNLSPTSSVMVCVTMSENCPSPTVQQCLNITVPSYIPPMMTSDIVSGCYPVKVVFYNLSPGNLGSTHWQFSDGGSGVSYGNDSLIYIFENPGLYDVTMTVTSVEGCVSDTSFSDYIEIYDYPSALFSYMPLPASIFDPEVTFNNFSSADVVQWYWEFGSGVNPSSSSEINPVVLYPQGIPGDYPVTLQVWNQDGCKDSVSGVVSIVSEVIVFAPNVFTPDGDDKNQNWGVYVQGIDIYDFHLTLFNRWGEIVWESYNPSATWNGHYGSQGIVSDGTYVWVIETKDAYNDKKYEFRGHVTVLK